MRKASSWAVMSLAAFSRIGAETIAVFAAFAALLIYRHSVEAMPPEFTVRRGMRAVEGVRRPVPDLSGVLI